MARFRISFAESACCTPPGLQLIALHAAPPRFSTHCRQKPAGPGGKSRALVRHNGPSSNRNAQRLFAAQEPRKKRRLLNWEDGEVVATFREPFDMLAETVANSTVSEAA
jgi:hypothetical protein